MVEIPLFHLKDECVAVTCAFKIRRSYQKQLRRSDLSSILSSQNYVRILRNDENLSKHYISRIRKIEVFPFKEIDAEIQAYGQHFYVNSNFPIARYKTSISFALKTIDEEIEKLRKAAVLQEEEENKKILQMKIDKEKIEKMESPESKPILASPAFKTRNLLYANLKKGY